MDISIDFCCKTTISDVFAEHSVGLLAVCQQAYGYTTQRNSDLKKKYSRSLSVHAVS